MTAPMDTSAAGTGPRTPGGARDPATPVPAAILAGASELSNLRFLVEQQLRAIDELDRRGLDGRDARDLLARLMRRHEEIRSRPAAPRPLRVA